MIGEERFSQLVLLWTVFIAALCRARPTKDTKKHFSNVLRMKPHNVNEFKSRVTRSITRVHVLYSKNTGKHVRIVNNQIDGLGTESDRSGESNSLSLILSFLTSTAKLIFVSAGFGGQVRIRSYHENLYICLTNRGYPVVENAKVAKAQDRCIFIDDQYMGYTTYKSKINPRWFFGIRNTGEAKPAYKINIRQRAAHFLNRKTVTN